MTILLLILVVISLFISICSLFLCKKIELKEPISGERGIQGIQGYRGYQGESGHQGPQGYQGYQGIQGAPYDSSVVKQLDKELTKSDILLILKDGGDDINFDCGISANEFLEK